MKRLLSLTSCTLAALLVACAGPATDDAVTASDAVQASDSASVPWFHDMPKPFADESPLVPEVDDPITDLPWASVGTGVAYKDLGTGTNVAIIYGGYTAQLEWVERWCDEMVRLEGAALDIRHLYAVQGPNDAGYANREIQNSKLAEHLGTASRIAGASRMVVIAHSSGTYVADEFFGDVKSGRGGIPADTPPKIAYFDLDGGGPADMAFVKLFARTYFVWAHDAVIGRDSHNASGMQALGAEYAALGGAFEVNANGSGCDAHAAGGLWCMHDTLINTKPHDPVMYDLKDDYTDFTNGRALVTAYLDEITPAP